MPLPALALCVNLGILPLLFLPTLPEIEHVWMIAVTGLLLASRHQRYIRYAGFTVLFFARDYWQHCRSCGLHNICRVRIGR